MVNVDEVTENWLGEQVRVNGVEGVLTAIRVDVNTAVEWAVGETQKYESSEETWLYIGGEWLVVHDPETTPIELLKERRTGYALLYSNSEGEAVAASKVYANLERAKENALPSDKIATVTYWV